MSIMRDAYILSFLLLLLSWPALPCQRGTSWLKKGQIQDICVKICRLYLNNTECTHNEKVQFSFIQYLQINIGGCTVGYTGQVATTNRQMNYAGRRYEAVEERLSEDMNILTSILKNWCLKLSVDKII